VKTSRNRRVDADREVVVDDVARYRVTLLVPVVVPAADVVVVGGVGRCRVAAAATAAAITVAVGDRR